MLASRLFQHTTGQETNSNLASASLVLGEYSNRHNPVKVRVLRVPPSLALEGIDLRPYKLQEGIVYDLEPQVAKVLIVWKYAERVSPRRRRGKPKK